MIQIPKQLQNESFRFVLLGKWDEIIYKEDKKPTYRGKAPFELEWQTKNNYKFDNEKLLNHPNNFGVIGGYGNLRILDIDNLQLAEEFEKKIDTYTVKTGSGGRHFYFISDYDKNHVLINELGELRANNYQVVSAPSKHPSGNYYEIAKDIPIKEITKEELYTLIKPYLRTETPQDLTISELGKPQDTSRSGLEFRKVLALLREGKSREEIYKVMEAYSKWATAPEQYKTLTFEKAENFVLQEREKAKEISGKYLFNDIGKLSNFLNIAEEFIKIQPIYYDKYKIWWIWNHKEFKWERIDETDIFNAIDNSTKNPSTNATIKSELLEGLRRKGRLNKPKEPKESWVQFNNKIYDLESEEILEATPEYFITNPIKWKMGETEETPALDILFKSWVGENYQELYELLAFCIVPNYFIHRIFCLIGSGANGKSTYLNVLSKFIGEDNITSSSLFLLMGQRFEGSKLLKKLTCLMGETNFNMISNTDYIKKLTGQDLVRAEFKGKDCFDFRNYAKLIIATNSLPPTADKTDGFYRRWKIMEFNNKFKEEKDVLFNVQDEEYENLALKCFNIAKRLWKERRFTNDGDFEQRKRVYEEKSNPLMTFIKENYEKDIQKEVLFSEFYDDLSEFLESRGFRTLSAKAVSQQVKNEGFDIKTLQKGGVNGRFIIGLNHINHINHLCDQKSRNDEKLEIVNIVNMVNNPFQSYEKSLSEKALAENSQRLAENNLENDENQQKKAFYDKLSSFGF